MISPGAGLSAVAIVGPTAVGKSDVADRLAARLSSEVLSSLGQACPCRWANNVQPVVPLFGHACVLVVQGRLDASVIR